MQGKNPVAPSENPVFIISSESDANQLLNNKPSKTWLCWIDKNKQHRLSYVKKPTQIIHLDQQQKWDKIMRSGSSIDRQSIIEALSCEDLLNQVLCESNSKPALTITEYIAVLRQRALTDEKINGLFPKNLDEKILINIKEQIFLYITQIPCLSTRKQFCEQLIENDKNPYSYILRMSESWSAVSGFFNSNSQPSKIRVKGLLDETSKKLNIINVIDSQVSEIATNIVHELTLAISVPSLKKAPIPKIQVTEKKSEINLMVAEMIGSLRETILAVKNKLQEPGQITEAQYDLEIALMKDALSDINRLISDQQSSYLM